MKELLVVLGVALGFIAVRLMQSSDSKEEDLLEERMTGLAEMPGDIDPELMRQKRQNAKVNFPRPPRNFVLYIN